MRESEQPAASSPTATARISSAIVVVSGQLHRTLLHDQSGLGEAPDCSEGEGCGEPSRENVVGIPIQAAVMMMMEGWRGGRVLSFLVRRRRATTFPRYFWGREEGRKQLPPRLFPCAGDRSCHTLPPPCPTCSCCGYDADADAAPPPVCSC